MKLGLISCALAFLAQNASADVLSQLDVSGSAGIDSIQTGIDFTIGNAMAPIGFSNSFTLQFDSSDLGKTLLFTPTEDPTFFSNLTNGSSNLIGILYVTPAGGGAGFAEPEGAFFTSYPAGWNGIDFQGFNIDDVSLTVNSISFNSPGSNPNHDGQYTDYTFNATLAVNGQAAPEPSALALAIIMSGLFLGLRRFSARENG